jgi:hypothetical protein
MKGARSVQKSIGGKWQTPAELELQVVRVAAGAKVQHGIEAMGGNAQLTIKQWIVVARREQWKKSNVLLQTAETVIGRGNR